MIPGASFLMCFQCYLWIGALLIHLFLYNCSGGLGDGVRMGWFPFWSLLHLGCLLLKISCDDLLHLLYSPGIIDFH